MENWLFRLRKKWLYRPRKSGFLGYGKSGFIGHGKVALLATYKSMSEDATLIWLATPLFLSVCSICSSHYDIVVTVDWTFARH